MQLSAGQLSIVPPHAAPICVVCAQAVKSLAMREDGGRGLTPGGRVVALDRLCSGHQLVPRVLGMLWALQPVQHPRRGKPGAASSPWVEEEGQDERAGAGEGAGMPAHSSSNVGAGHSRAPSAAATQAKTPLPVPPAPATATLADVGLACAVDALWCTGMPLRPPYDGYRGDVLAVLANAMHNRSHVAEAIAAVPRASLLILSQVSSGQGSISLSLSLSAT